MGHRLRLTIILLILAVVPAYGDLAVPAWYAEAGASWHYRLRLDVPAGAASGSTVVVDVDFAAALSSLGIDAGAVDFDEPSVRVVGPAGVLVAEQQFTDHVYAGVLDPLDDGRGEVRFIFENSGAYFLYFDITANGSKPPAPAAVINGGFEQSAGGDPSAWVRSAVNTGGAENNEVYRTVPGSTMKLARDCGSNPANKLDTSPNTVGGSSTGGAWLLLGYRDRCEDGTGSERVQVSRDIQVPAAGAAGVLEFYFQVQAFDGIVDSGNYDWITFSVDGVPVDHTALNIDNSTSPQLVIDGARLGRDRRWRQVDDFGWKQAQLDLSGYAGRTINFRVETRHSPTDNDYRTWVKIDDVVWSRQTATVGAAEAFGVNVVLPADTSGSPASQYAAGSTLAVSAAVDADVGAVSAEVMDMTGTIVAANIALFDDGSHGDATANDGIWTNDGSVPADPTYTFSSADPLGSGWLVRVFAPDASTATGGIPNGLLLRPGQSTAPVTETNYYNIDAQTFTLGAATLLLEKTLDTLTDGVGGGQPKSLPGAWIRYQISVTNTGPSTTDANSVILLDSIPPEVAVCVSPVCTCVAPCTQTDPVTFDDSASPVPTGLGYDYATDVAYSLDGSDFSYTPQPDAAGFDPAIRYIRVVPGGTMAAPDAAGEPEFLLRYVVQLR